MHPIRLARPTNLACVATLLGGLAGPGMAAPAAPWLTLADDSGVQLKVNQVTVTAQGPFVRTVIDVALSNPFGGRPLAADVRLALQPHERLRGHALDVAGVLRAAVAVERVQARVTFEAIQRRNVDPALVEQDAGNAVRLRVFPVPAGGPQRLLRIELASLAERRACGWFAELPAGLSATAEQLTVNFIGHAAPQAQGLKLAQAKGEHTGTAKKQATPKPVSWCQPVAAGPAAAQAFTATVLGEPAQLVALPAASTTTPRTLPGDVEIVWDASLSMAQRPLARELALLRAYFHGRDATVRLQVLQHGQPSTHRTVPVRAGRTDVLESWLRAATADGATDLSDWVPHPTAAETLLFTDAVSTWPGGTRPQPQRPVVVVSAGAGADPIAAAALARHGGQWIVLEGQSDEQAARQLLSQGHRLVAGAADARGGWQMPSLVPQRGALWACHLGVAAAGPAGTLRSRTPDGRLQAVTPAGEPTEVADAAFWCATWQAEALQADPLRHRGAITRLGKALGLVTSETSLLVLESDADHVRHGVLPTDKDSPLFAQVQAALQRQALAKTERERRAQAQLRSAWQERRAWWEKDFPASKPPVPVSAAKVTSARPEVDTDPRAVAAERARAEASARETPRPAPVGMPAPAAAMALAPAPAPAAARVAGAAPPPPASPDSGNAPTTIALKAPRPNEPYTERLAQAANADDAYAIYLDLRPDYQQSPAFYLDVAERLFKLDDSVRAARVLSNIVELLPRQQAALRIVAYRLLQADQVGLATALLQAVQQLAPDEPQSHRDLGLALARMGDCQGAVDALARVANGAWDNRFADIGLVALAELNATAARCDRAPDRSAIDASLHDALPVGLRAVLTWDLNDTDIDLHVTDPNGETASYAKRATWQGGRMSRDFTAGYGPEEFVLKRPIPGIYKVEVHYFGSRAPVLSRGAVVQLALQAGFGTAKPQERTVVLRLKEAAGKTLVGSFEVGEGGQLAPAPASANRP